MKNSVKTDIVAAWYRSIVIKFIPFQLERPEFFNSSQVVETRFYLGFFCIKFRPILIEIQDFNQISAEMVFYTIVFFFFFTLYIYFLFLIFS